MRHCSKNDTAGSCCGPENAAGRPAAGRNDVHCAVVAVTVDVLVVRAGLCGQRLYHSSGVLCEAFFN